MNKSKLLYFYSDENNLKNQENFDLVTIDLCIINSKDTIVNYSSVYNKIKSLNIDAIIIDKSSFVLDMEIFEFATYIRLMKNNIWDVPIYIYCNFGYKAIIEFLKSDKTNISKTNRFEIINNSLFEKDALEIGKIKFFQNLEQKKQESLNWNDFIKTINVEKPETSNHTISNEWAIYRWAHAIGANDSDIEKIENKVENNIYFKYLQAIYPITEIQEIREEQLKVENLQDSKILYIDDEADKGWYEVMCTIIADINKVKDFDYLGNELKNKTQNEIIDLSIKKIKEYEAEILILDFRLHKNDFDCSIKEVTGYKLLQAIKEINPGIQVIIFSATNKVWNLQALQNAGADGFIIKESPENSVDSNFTQEVIISFIQELDKANKRIFLIKFYENYEPLKKEMILRKNYKKHLHPLPKEFVDESLKWLLTSYNLLNKETSETNFTATYLFLFSILENLATRIIDIENPLKHDSMYLFEFRKDHNKLKLFNQEKSGFYVKSDLNLELSSMRIPWSQKIFNTVDYLNSKLDESVDINVLVKKRNDIIHANTTTGEKINISIEDIKNLNDIIINGLSNVV